MAKCSCHQSGLHLPSYTLVLPSPSPSLPIPPTAPPPPALPGTSRKVFATNDVGTHQLLVLVGLVLLAASVSTAQHTVCCIQVLACLCASTAGTQVPLAWHFQ